MNSDAKLMAKENIIVITFSSKGKAKAIPIIKRELKHNHHQVVLLGKDISIPMELRHKILARDFEYYLDEQAVEELENDALRFVTQGIPNTKTEGAEHELSHRGISLWDIIHLPAAVVFIGTMRYFRIAERVIEREQPKKVILISDKGSSMPWLDVGSVLIEKGLFHRMASQIVNSRRGTLEEEVMLHVMKSRGVAASVIPLGAVSYLHHYFSRYLLPLPIRLFFQFCEFRRKISDAIHLSKRSRKPVKFSRKICLIVQTKNEAITAAPVVKALQKDEQNEVLVIKADGPLTNFAQKTLEMEGIPYKTYESYITREVSGKTRKAVKSLSPKWRRLKHEKAFRQFFDYRGVSWGHIMVDTFVYMFSSLFPGAIKHIETINHVIDSEKPDIIILQAYSSTIERTANLVAKSRGVPTLAIPYAFPGRKLYPTPVDVDKTIVWSEAMKNLLIEQKMATADKCVITGNPSFEYLLQKLEDFNREEFYRQMGVVANRSIILFASQPIQYPITPEIREQLIRCVYDAAKELPDVQFVVKLHPGEGFDLHRELKAEMGLGNVVITKDVNLYYLLKICDVMITLFSTTAMEAMIMDKPVIIVDLIGIADALPYADSGAALGVYKEEDLLPAIKATLHDEEVRQRLAESRERFVLKYAGPQDGQAANRVASLVMQMIKESRRRKSKVAAEAEA